MEYEDLNPRIPEIKEPSYGMSIVGYCLCKFDNNREDELVFVVGRMSSMARNVSADQTYSADWSYNPFSDTMVNNAILLYYPKDRRENENKRPEFFNLSGLEKCIWLEETKT